jgi:hypothetical protein
LKIKKSYIILGVIFVFLSQIQLRIFFDYHDNMPLLHVVYILLETVQTLVLRIWEYLFTWQFVLLIAVIVMHINISKYLKNTEGKIDRD